MDNPIPPFAVQAGEGIVLETPTGDTAIIKADTGQTNGSLTVIELIIGPKQGPALHTHHRDDELWVVLEGDFRFKTGGAILPAYTRVAWRSGRAAPHTRFKTLEMYPDDCWLSRRPRGSRGSSRTSPRSCEPVQSAQRRSQRSAARTVWTSSVLPWRSPIPCRETNARSRS